MKVRLYRIYNIEKDREGEPFGMCDAHYETWQAKDKLIVNKIADESLIPCNQCTYEEREKQEAANQ